MLLSERASCIYHARSTNYCFRHTSTMSMRIVRMTLIRAPYSSVSCVRISIYSLLDRRCQIAVIITRSLVHSFILCYIYVCVSPNSGVCLFTPCYIAFNSDKFNAAIRQRTHDMTPFIISKSNLKKKEDESVVNPFHTKYSIQHNLNHSLLSLVRKKKIFLILVFFIFLFPIFPPFAYLITYK